MPFINKIPRPDGEVLSTKPITALYYKNALFFWKLCKFLLAICADKTDDKPRVGLQGYRPLFGAANLMLIYKSTAKVEISAENVASRLFQISFYSSKSS